MLSLTPTQHIAMPFSFPDMMMATLNPTLCIGFQPGQEWEVDHRVQPLPQPMDPLTTQPTNLQPVPQPLTSLIQVDAVEKILLLRMPAKIQEVIPTVDLAAMPATFRTADIVDLMSIHLASTRIFTKTISG